MPEAEDVITDAARIATVFARDLWRRHHAAPAGAPAVDFDALVARLDLLVRAAFGRHYALRIAEPPAPPTFLAKLFDRARALRTPQAVPATDDRTIWLPRVPGTDHPALAHERLRTMALQQAARATRGIAATLVAAREPRERAYCLVLEADAADRMLVERLPGLRTGVERLRRDALAARPRPEDLPPPLRALEGWLQSVLARPPGAGLLATAGRAPGEPAPGEPAHCAAGPAASLACARALAAAERVSDEATERRSGRRGTPMLRGRGTAIVLLPDLWTGEVRVPPPDAGPSETLAAGLATETPESAAPRTARLARRPRVRAAEPDEDDAQPGPWMVQTSQPHEHAEDPLGLQRATDRDAQTAAEDFADSVAELEEARLVATPGAPREVLLGDDPPPTSARSAEATATASESLAYPEWDYRLGAYRTPGATVRLLPAALGPAEWVARTLDEHRATLQTIRRRFEMLRARRVRLRRQYDGDDIDLDAWIEGRADFRAGRPMPEGVYLTDRTRARDLAIGLLVDVSGSTDSWVGANRRIVDVEREALLLVCGALEGLGEPYLVQAFSGDGPPRVTVRTLKRFDERYGLEVQRRIAGLEPERYTRAGGALRHATTLLMRQPARHRLLLLLSDGKPHDADVYEGRYGVEDVRQAVVEARLQGVQPFCLTIDRQASAYLPRIFGAGHYALLPTPEDLPLVLLGWMRRLVSQ